MFFLCDSSTVPFHLRRPFYFHLLLLLCWCDGGQRGGRSGEKRELRGRLFNTPYPPEKKTTCFFTLFYILFPASPFLIRRLPLACVCSRLLAPFPNPILNPLDLPTRRRRFLLIYSLLIGRVFTILLTPLRHHYKKIYARSAIHRNRDGQLGRPN